jgi:hypothetical protein
MDKFDKYLSITAAARGAKCRQCTGRNRILTIARMNCIFSGCIMHILCVRPLN